MRRWLWTFAALCLVLALADFAYHRHTHYSWEEWPGFYALFGFVAFALIVLSGRPLRRLLARDEDYYDR